MKSRRDISYENTKKTTSILSFLSFVILFSLQSCAKKVPKEAPKVEEKKEEEIDKKVKEKEEIVERTKKLTFREAKAVLVPDPYVMFGLALRKEREGEIEEAEKFYEYTIELKPSMAEAWVNLAELKKKKGNIDEAIKVLEEGLKIIREDPKIWASLSLTYLESGKNKKSEEVIQNAISQVGMKKEVAMAMGYSFLQNQRYNLALFVFDELSKKYPDDPDIYFFKGEIYMRAKNWQNAIYEFEKGLKIKKDPIVLTKLGICYLNLNAVEQAEASLQSAIKIDPKLKEAYSNLGIIYKRKGNFEKAEEMYKKALEISPDPNILYNLANLYETMASYYQMSAQKSIEYMRLAIKNLTEYLNFINNEKEKEFIQKRIEKIEKAEQKMQEKLQKEIKKLEGSKGENKSSK